MSFFHPMWHIHNRFTTDSSHKATIRIYRTPTDKETSWTPEEGIISSPDNIVYEGPARWQKRGQVTSQDFASDVAKFQRVQIQISMKRFQEFAGMEERIHVNDRIELIENESNPFSEQSLVYVWGFPTSSNAWNITLICQENYKQDAHVSE